MLILKKNYDKIKKNIILIFYKKNKCKIVSILLIKFLNFND